MSVLVCLSKQPMHRLPDASAMISLVCDVFLALFVAACQQMPTLVTPGECQTAVLQRGLAQLSYLTIVVCAVLSLQLTCDLLCQTPLWCKQEFHFLYHTHICTRNAFLSARGKPKFTNARLSPALSNIPFSCSFSLYYCFAHALSQRCISAAEACLPGNLGSTTV